MNAASRLLACLGLVLSAACSEADLLEPSRSDTQPEEKLASDPHAARFVTVMTRNLYVGTDLDAVIYGADELRPLR